MDFDLSYELRGYGEALREWGLAEVRPCARDADRNQKVPENHLDILDTAPVWLNRPDQPDAPPAEFPDGKGVAELVRFESIAYGDVWLFEALERGMGHEVVRILGTPEQIGKWYTPVVQEGGIVTGFGMTEAEAGSDTSRIATTAVRDGGTWVLNGGKIFCSLGSRADYTVVFATTDRTKGSAAIKAFVVEAGTPGMTVVKANEDKIGLRSWVTSQLAFDNCVIPLGNLLGWGSDSTDLGAIRGLSAGLAGLNDNRPNVSALAIGLAQAALDTTGPLLKERRPGFTTPRWQLIKTDLLAMTEALERARLLNLRAQALRDQGMHNRLEASIAKAYGPPIAERVIRRCIQLLGPDGASTDLLLEKWYRDVKIFDIVEGTGQVMRVLIGRQLMPTPRRP
jgi:acyl-CoA dehydrogenase